MVEDRTNDGTSQLLYRYCISYEIIWITSGTDVKVTATRKTTGSVVTRREHGRVVHD